MRTSTVRCDRGDIADANLLHELRILESRGVSVECFSVRVFEASGAEVEQFRSELLWVPSLRRAGISKAGSTGDYWMEAGSAQDAAERYFKED